MSTQHSREYDRRSWTLSYRNLIEKIVSMGYPQEFGKAIASSLGSEKAMDRMSAYLDLAKPKTAEEIADEMLAITSEIDRWKQKKETEYYNSKYNELLWYGLPGEEDEDG